jgi:hypothetical protein
MILRAVCAPTAKAAISMPRTVTLSLGLNSTENPKKRLNDSCPALHD